MRVGRAAHGGAIGEEIVASPSTFERLPLVQ